MWWTNVKVLKSNPELTFILSVNLGYEKGCVLLPSITLAYISLSYMPIRPLPLHPNLKDKTSIRRKKKKKEQYLLVTSLPSLPKHLRNH